MKIFGMGGFELVIILIVILLIFGPKNLPKLGNALGKTVSNLRSGMNEGKKKKEETEETDESAEGEPAEESKPAEIVGEVEEVADVVFEESEDVSFEDQDVDVEETESPSVAEDGADGESHDESAAPKKVKRVVRKKVVKE